MQIGLEPKTLEPDHMGTGDWPELAMRCTTQGGRDERASGERLEAARHQQDWLAGG